MRRAARMSSAVWLPHVILQVEVSLMGMGILKRLSEIDTSIEEMSGKLERGNSKGYMEIRYPYLNHSQIVVAGKQRLEKIPGIGDL